MGTSAVVRCCEGAHTCRRATVATVQRAQGLRSAGNMGMGVPAGCGQRRRTRSSRAPSAPPVPARGAQSATGAETRAAPWDGGTGAGQQQVVNSRLSTAGASQKRQKTGMFSMLAKRSTTWCRQGQHQHERSRTPSHAQVRPCAAIDARPGAALCSHRCTPRCGPAQPSMHAQVWPCAAIDARPRCTAPPQQARLCIGHDGAP